MAEKEQKFSRIIHNSLAQALGISLIVFIASLTSGFYLNRLASNLYRNEVHTNLLNVGYAAAAMIDPELHPTFTSAEQMSSPEYQQALEPLRKLLFSQKQVKYIYSAIRRDGKIYFVLDSALPEDGDGDGVIDQAQIMEEYEEPDQAMIEVFETQKPLVSSEPYTDKWGTFLSGFVPIQDRNGQMLGIIGVDITAERYQQEMDELRRMSLLGLALAMLISVGLGIGVFFIQKNRYQLQRRQMEINRQLNLVLNNAQVGFWSWNIQTGDVSLDDNWIRILGYEPGELPHRLETWEKSLHPQDRTMVMKILNRHLQDGRCPYDVEYRAQHRSGQWIWINAKGSVQKRDDQGRALIMMGTIQNTTKIKQSELEAKRLTAEQNLLSQVAEIGATAESYNHALENILCLVCTSFDWQAGHVYSRTDENGNTQLISSRIWYLSDEQILAQFKAVSEQYIFSPGVDLPGRTLLSGQSECIPNIHQDDRFIRAKRCPDLPIQGAAAIPVKLREKTRLIIEFFSIDEMFQTPQLFKFLNRLSELISRLVERKMVETQIQEYAKALENSNQTMQEAVYRAEAATQAKSSFLANMSHEIRTPMTAILGYAENLEDPALSPGERLACAQTIRRNGEHLLQIINDILDLSKIEAGKMTVECVPCSPCQIISDVYNLMNIRAKKGVELKVKYAGAMPLTIQSDPTRLRQTITNLVGNALKFTEAGSVTIHAGIAGQANRQMLNVEVIDTGCGMSADYLIELFKPFTQADSSTTRKFGGTGLGLTITKRIVELLGGTIEVTSDVGKGSVFCIAVPTGPLDHVEWINQPIDENLLQKQFVKKPMAVHLKGRILLVEDSADNQRLISFILKKAGAKVEVADNGQIGITVIQEAILKGEPFDLILMDMQMPVMDGYLATRLLREQGYRGPIIALTANVMSDDRDKCLAAGCDDFATKPISRDTLLNTINTYLQRNTIASLKNIQNQVSELNQLIQNVSPDTPAASPKMNNPATPKI